jgi:transposase-like protein
MVGNNEIRSRRDLSEEEIADAMDFFDGGATPRAVAKEMGIPLPIVQNLKRDWRRLQREEEGTPTATAPVVHTIPTSPSPPLPADPLTAQLNAQLQAEMHQEMLYMQLENLKEQRAHRKRMNEIEIDERLQTLAERRARAREEYGDIDEDEEEPEPTESALTGQAYDFEGNPFGSLMKFLTDLKKKNDSPQTTMTPHIIDATKPVTDAQIQEIIKATPKTTLMMMKAASDEQLKNGLKQQFPGITEENLIKAIHQIRHYEV